MQRRHFLASACATGLAVPLTWAQRREHDISTVHSPVIDTLKSRRSEAKPITMAERRDRIARAQQLMAQNKIDALCMIGGTSLAYFTGIRWGDSERPVAPVLPQRGHAFYVSPAFEEDRAREQILESPDGDSCRVLTWQEDESPYVLVAKGLQDAGIKTGRIGIKER